MKQQSDFLKKYNIQQDCFDRTDLKWEELIKIYNDYLNYRDELEQSAVYVFNTLMKAKKVHSVRYRIKDPEHLIEKIIRKKIESPESSITLENYKSELFDLIGLRALHLFKDEWLDIDTFIKHTWNLKQNPVANFRKGDSEQLIKVFKEHGCDTKEHKYGYRSVHYIIETQPGKQKHIVEIQIRTIFEEAWSEIDHTVRYPYDLENPIFSQFLSILNRLAGGADEMGTFIKFLQKELAARDRLFNQQLSEKDKLITELELKLEKFNLNDEELRDVKLDLDKLRKPQSAPISKITRRKSILDYLNENENSKKLNSFTENTEYYEKIRKSSETLNKLSYFNDIMNKLNRPKE